MKSKEEGKFEVTGIISYSGEGQAEITELPVKRWTQDSFEKGRDIYSIIHIEYINDIWYITYR